jgi:predicted Rossmann fold flavoprotein
MSATFPRHADVLVLGAGAAGLFCAAVAGQRGRKVTLLEHNDRIGKKIQISGGGRCNFTNLHATAANYLSARPDFCKSALARYTPQDFLRLVESHGIAYHEKKLGQQFCDTSSREIIDLLLAECRDAKVDLHTGCRIQSVRKTEKFAVETAAGTWTCDALVIATGGLSFPKLGASDFGYRLARQFGLAVTEVRPGLVPLTFDEKDHGLWSTLSGLSLPVVIRHRGTSFAENILVTHRGFSGPAILQISSYWREGENLGLDLLPDIEADEWMRRPDLAGKTPEQALSSIWPQRFAHTWCKGRVPARPLAQLSTAQRADLGQELKQWKWMPAGTEGYPKAEVTLGGISTDELSSKTMESRRVPGLYFIGEVVDVTGWLGGYNFQWAWASAHAAGQAV